MLELILRIKKAIQYKDYVSRALPIFINELCKAMEYLAAHKIGGLVVIERKNNIDLFVAGAVHIDAEIKAELIEAIFSKTSPVHDGAIIIRNERINRIKAILPLTANAEVALHYGTRHRAALGISENSDAIVLVSSEERGELSVAYRGSLYKVKSEKELVGYMKKALHGKI
jgi:diadenylate cyclase